MKNLPSLEQRASDIEGPTRPGTTPRKTARKDYTFNYDVNSPSGHAHWKDQGPGPGACDASRAASRQSPVDIITPALKRAIVRDPLVYNHQSGALAGNLRNNGHSPVFEFDIPDRILSGVPNTTDEYELLQFHMHFGPNDVTGSEHLLDGSAFPAELHFVHKNRKYTSIGEALKHEDGLAVIGVFVELSPYMTDAPLLEIVNNFPKIQTVGHDVELSVDPNLMLPTPTAGRWGEYMTYPGSLTTQGCFEVVRWIILPDNLQITSAELEKARALLTGRAGSEPFGKVGNFRPPQPMNGRKVEYVTVRPDAPAAEHKGLSHTFDYDLKSPSGPLHWAELDPGWEACDASRNGKRQSPIDVPLQSLVPTSGGVLTYNTLSGRLSGSLRNNGHWPVFEFDLPERVLTGVPYSSDEYELLQFHIHFGPDDTSGSEHLMGGKAFPAEIHFLHKNRKYPSVKEALQHEDGLAVIGVFVQVGPTGTSETLQEIVSNLDAIKAVGPGLPLLLDPNDLMPSPGNWSEYITYPGSLTTPGCFEVVRWLLLQDPVTITADELQKFRTLLTGDADSEPMGTMGNFRPPQPLNSRQVELVQTA
ncbi:uncharacterized protein LOC135477812 [Liolophura sinensis]|uniref:uncharacterized protein LOC135477812 n=1 Tax=Liolophura sinensis TaxID=3198878 RepID=UPI0031596C10